MDEIQEKLLWLGHKSSVIREGEDLRLKLTDTLWANENAVAPCEDQKTQAMLDSQLLLYELWPQPLPLEPMLDTKYYAPIEETGPSLPGPLMSTRGLRGQSGQRRVATKHARRGASQRAVPQVIWSEVPLKAHEHCRCLDGDHAFVVVRYGRQERSWSFQMMCVPRVLLHLGPSHGEQSTKQILCSRAGTSQVGCALCTCALSCVPHSYQWAKGPCGSTQDIWCKAPKRNFRPDLQLPLPLCSYLTTCCLLKHQHHFP